MDCKNRFYQENKCLIDDNFKNEKATISEYLWIENNIRIKKEKG